MLLDGQANIRWQRSLRPDICNIHSFSDPLIADYDTDGHPEVLAPTSNKTLNAYYLSTGEVEFREPLTLYGFSQPMVENVTGDSRPETVVIDILGGTFAYEPSGEQVWMRNFSDARVRQPEIMDFDADGRPEIPVGQTLGETIMLNHNGSIAWRKMPKKVITSRWMAVGQADRDAAKEVIRGSFKGFVVALDGQNGTTEWRRSFSKGATVHALGDGRDEIFQMYTDGRVAALAYHNQTASA